MAIIFSPLMKNDMPQLVGMMQRSLPGHGDLGKFGVDRDFWVNYIYPRMAEPDGQFLGYGAFQEDQILVGALVAMRSPNLFNPAHHMVMISYWFVEPEFRGLGIGTALMDNAENWAASHNCEQVVLPMRTPRPRLPGWKLVEHTYLKEV